MPNLQAQIRIVRITHTTDSLLFGGYFKDVNEKQQQEILSDIEETRENGADINAFYGLMKEKTIQGYLTSQYVLTNINKYEFIPSEKYNGYAPVKS